MQVKEGNNWVVKGRTCYVMLGMFFQIK